MDVDESPLVRAAIERLRRRVLVTDDDEDPGEGTEALDALTPDERALLVTSELEAALADGGWYLVFADNEESLLEPAIEGYERLGLPAYAAHLREVVASGFGDASPEAEGERLDEAFAELSGSTAAREALASRLGLLEC
jgi:hypothetical protein